MSFIITGHESEHGGPTCAPPTLVFTDGVNSVFKHPSIVPPGEVVLYATLADAQLAAAKIPRTMWGVEVDVSKDGQGTVIAVATKLAGQKLLLPNALPVVVSTGL